MNEYCRKKTIHNIKQNKIFRLYPQSKQQHNKMYQKTSKKKFLITCLLKTFFFIYLYIYFQCEENQNKYNHKKSYTTIKYTMILLYQHFFKMEIQFPFSTTKETFFTLYRSNLS